MNPHQVDAALFALQSPLSKGVLLADEVGLDRWGLVIAQRWAEPSGESCLLCRISAQAVDLGALGEVLAPLPDHGRPQLQRASEGGDRSS